MDKKHISIPSILIIIVSLSIILSGCNTEYETPSPDEPIIIPDEPITQAKTEGMSNIVDANNEFAVKCSLTPPVIARHFVDASLSL